MLKLRPDKSDSYFEVVLGCGSKLEDTTKIDMDFDLHQDKPKYEMSFAFFLQFKQYKQVFLKVGFFFIEFI